MIVARHEMPGIGLTGTRPVGHGVNSVSRSGAHRQGWDEDAIPSESAPEHESLTQCFPH
jgi:hypothetical protein